MVVVEADPGYQFQYQAQPRFKPKPDQYAIEFDFSDVFGGKEEG